MAKFAVSFRFDINTAAGASYSERYSSFMEQVRKTGAWEETTSFALVTSGETLDQFSDRLYYQSHFCAVTDTMLVIDIETGRAISRGKIDYPATLRGKLNGLTQK